MTGDSGISRSACATNAHEFPPNLRVAHPKSPFARLKTWPQPWPQDSRPSKISPKPPCLVPKLRVREMQGQQIQ